MSTTPPAVRWAREPDGGVYVFAPGDDRWYVVYPWGNLGRATEAPPGAEVLVTLTDAGNAIDAYRDSLRLEDQADGVPHAVARRHALAELSDAADLPLWAPRDGNAARRGDDTQVQ